MARRLLLTMAVLLATTSLGTAPARADADACAGVVNVSLNYTFGLPTVHAWSFASMDITFSPGGCVASDLVMTGYLNGWCGRAFGVGTAGDGHSFSFEWVGTQFVFTSPVTAAMTVVETPGTGSCTNRTATSLTGVGVFAKTHLD